ncbi:MAG TPA: dihydropyrimidine dehydrogenase, partial [Kofleriaceae bacterium]|nr:dihydropyrimidine dehydrogenase [Kofleriaceae bacterium]
MPIKRPDKTHMPVREPGQRAHDFLEVNTGYNAARAAFEAERCLRCQDPVCVGGCPVNVPIPDFMHAIAVGDLADAARRLRSANPLPAICGRVCPQESQCEAACSMTARFEPVAIGNLERYVADWERGQDVATRRPAARARKVAVIGAGPAGLVCA